MVPVQVENKDGSQTTMHFDLGTLLAAMRSQGAKKKLMKGQKEEVPPTTSDSKNSKFVLCPQCHCKILKPGKATLVEKKVFLHHVSLREQEKKQEGENLTKFWLVTDQFQFENIGVSKNVSEHFKYLACADCDLGPVGIRFTSKPSEFFIAHDRVVYALPPSADESSSSTNNAVVDKASSSNDATS
eukprot:CAMPEP_0197518478 /NCGR_PEP_ID=MMETSP1318-20131121/3684_1 /TAXON_ID=552666 /ORGANISM="Partenskyella glossopodia, Strain RCC365" /LENGTH=185 /DNA_ID=CAMNT_0043068849 /DNA_START=69 /DNA_END=626 /DNA_ORIENTATION=+